VPGIQYAQPKERADEIVSEAAERRFGLLELLLSEKLLRLEEFGDRILPMRRAHVLWIALPKSHLDGSIGELEGEQPRLFSGGGEVVTAQRRNIREGAGGRRGGSHQCAKVLYRLENHALLLLADNGVNCD